jgi:hypothetical protein
MLKTINHTITISLFLLIGVYFSFQPKQAFSYELTTSTDIATESPKIGNVDLNYQTYRTKQTLIASPYRLMSPLPSIRGYRPNTYPSRSITRSRNIHYHDYESDSKIRGRKVDDLYRHRNRRYQRRDLRICNTITHTSSNFNGFTTIKHQFCH